MKKIISLLLVLIMVASLGACASGKSDSDFKTRSTTTASQKTTITRGEVSNKVYTNDILGIEFNAPSRWEYSSDEEIAELMGYAVDIYFSDSKFQAYLNSNISVYDMMVIDSATNSNVIVGYENIKKTSNTNITEEEYLDATKKQMSNISGTYYKFDPQTQKVKLGDTEFTKLVATVTSYGTSMIQVFYVRKVEGYMGFVIVTLVNGYTIEQVEEMFK